AGPQRGRSEEERRDAAVVHHGSIEVRQHGDAEVRFARQDDGPPDRDVPLRLQGTEVVRIFLGITGASGAPYAARLLEALSGADVELGVCASSAGVEVLATELYGNPRLSRDGT